MTLRTLAAGGAATVTFEAILARLRAESNEHFGVADARLVPVRYEERPFSHLLRVGVCRHDSATPDAHVFVKIFKPKPADGGVEKMRRRVAHDFEVTRRIYEAMAQWDDLGAVRPVACYVDHLAVVTEQADGETLLARLEAHATWFPPAETREALCEVLARVGRWLRAFQSIDGAAGRISLGDLRGYVDLRLKRLVEHGVMTEVDRLRVLQHLETLGAAMRPMDFTDAIVHADLAPANILVSERRVVVLDFAMTNRGSYLHDISRLFLQLELLRAKPKFRGSLIRSLELALLRGFDPSLTPEHPLFRALLMLHRVNHLGTLSLRREPFPSNAFSTHIRRLHRRWIERELQAGAAVAVTP